MVFFIDKARSRPPPRLLTNVNKKMVFFNEGFPKVFPSVTKVFPLVTKVFPLVIKIFSSVTKVFPLVTKVFPLMTKGPSPLFI